MSRKIFRSFFVLILVSSFIFTGFTPVLAAPPTNDNFANAEVINSLPFSATVDNTEATTEPNEPMGCGFFRNVWYAFTPTETIALQIDMNGSSVGGSVSIFLASGPGISDLTFLTCASSGSSANLQLEAGKTYYLRVDSFGQAGTMQVNLQQLTPPANDNFANAEAISSLPFSVTVDNTDATTELNEPVGCGSLFRSVWYSFTPAENMAIQVGINSQVGGSVSLFLASGPGIADLTSLTCAFSNNSTNFQVEAGKTYYLRVDSFGQPGAMQVNLQQIFPPTNDNFANAEAINSLPFNTTVDNTNATIEPGEPQHCNSLFRSVWYSFTPAENMAVRVDTAGSTAPGNVNIYLASGSAIADLTFLTCASSDSSTNLQLEAGKTYYLRVDSSGQPGVIQVNLQQITPPANDNFANAEAINSLPFNTTVDNTNATIEPGEPVGCGSLVRSVWYSFTPAENMAVRMSINSQVSSSISIFLASGPGIADLTSLTCAFSNSSTILQVEAGKTYYLRVDSSGEPAAIQVSLTQAISPSNDNFASAEVVTSLPFSTTVDVTDATNQPNEPQNCYFMSTTVWYSFTPPETMVLRANTLGSSINGNVNIYSSSGAGFSDLQFLNCSGPSGSPTFTAEAGQTYYFQVGATSGESGTIQVNLQQAIPPANDNFASAEVVTSLPFSATVDVTDATNQTDEPQNCYSMDRTVWYSFTPPETMVLHANTLGSSINGNVNIYSSSGAGFSDLQFLNCSGPSNSPTFTAEAGQTYYFQVGAVFGESGTLKINLLQAISPPNDNFVNAEAISALPFSTSTDITDATVEPGEPQICYSMDRTVWYSFTPTETTTVRADTQGGAISGNVNIYRATGPAIADLQFLNCSGPFSSSTFTAEAGQKYYFQVGAAYGEIGTVQFNLAEVTVIKGRLTDAITNAPLPGNAPPFALATLYRVCGDNCLEFVSSQNADGEGRFRFDNYSGSPLPTGTYQIGVSANLYHTDQFGPFEFSGVNLDVGDLPIAPLPLIGSIRGRLVDAATGNPVSQAFTPSVQLYRCTDGNCFEFVNSQVTDSQGRFRFATDSSGNPLPVGTYQILAFADQYQQAQSDPFDVGEGMHRTIDNLRLTSFPVRFSEVQPCAEIPASGGECVFSLKIWNGLATRLRGAAWSLAQGSLPNSFVGFTNFQVKDSQMLDLDRGKSKVFRFRFNVPANNTSYGTSICTRLFAGEGSNFFFNTVGFRNLFCVTRNAGGFSIASPQEAIAFAQAEVTAVSTGTDIEPNNSCQTAQDIGAVPLPFVLDGNLDSSQTPDVDFFRFSGTPGAPIVVDLEGAPTGKGTVGDTFLGFFDSDCNFVASNDDSGTTNSRLEITIPADGVFILGATVCCDSGFNGGGDGTYQLTVTPIPVISSISGRVKDALTGKPLRGDVDPFAFVRLLQCSDFGCSDVNTQSTDSEGRFHFNSASNGAPLRVGNYMVVVSADQYQTGQTDVFAVGEGEDHDTGDVGLASFPVRFSETQPCVIPAEGGICEFNVRITNGLPTRLSGKAWSMISGSEIGSFTNFTNFQSDTLSDIRLNPGKSGVLRFRFRVRGSVADGATICATVYVGQGPNALFNTVGQNNAFCFVKGGGGFTLLSAQEAQAASHQMQNLILPNQQVEKKK